MNNKTVHYIPVLDSLRAFAALAVCSYHFICTTTGYINTSWILDLFSVGKYGVQLFFVISGFVIPWAMFNAKFKLADIFYFFLKRFIRLEPPYVASIILTLIILYVRTILLPNDLGNTTPTLVQVLLHFGYLIPFASNYTWLNNVYWTLAIEFQYYIFIALIFCIIIKANVSVRILFYLILIAASYSTSHVFFPFWLPFFGLGIVLFLSYSNLISKTEYYVVSGLITLFCIYKYPLAMVVFAIIPLMMILYCNTVKVFGLHFMGKFSYSIYLFHSIFGATFINIMSHHFTSFLAKFIVILVGFVITIVGSWITYILIEKPSKKLSAKIKYK